MRAEILCFGTELLLGQIVNTNAVWLAQELAKLGISLYWITTVGDNPERTIEAFEAASRRADLIITTGGLGPTDDDLTHPCLAQFLGVEMAERPELLARLESYFVGRKRPMSLTSRRMAALPEGTDILTNRIGAAPGCIARHHGVLILTFPGVPSETKIMWQEVAVPLLRSLAPVNSVLISRVLRFASLPEAALAEQVRDLLNHTNPTVAPLIGLGEVTLRLTAKAENEAKARALIAPMEQEIISRVGLPHFGADDDTLSSVVGRLLSDRQQTVAVAESCTGGLLGARISEVSGSSRYFLGGVIAYANQVKERSLSVSPELLREHGAVSAPVAEAMALGVRSALGADWGLSVTGIAGPDGGTPEKPVGLVYIAIAHPDGSVESREIRWGDRLRDEIRILSTQTILDWLRRKMLSVLA